MFDLFDLIEFVPKMSTTGMEDGMSQVAMITFNGDPKNWKTFESKFMAYAN